MRLFFAVILIAVLASCSNRLNKVTSSIDEPANPSKIAVTSVDEIDENIMKDAVSQSSPRNTRVIAKIIDRIETTDEDVLMNTMCANHPCRASIEFMAMTFHGSNFHGQYNEGDTVIARFVFTLDPTETIFPELNNPLPGLAVGDFFEAELFENDRGEYTIQIYDKK